MRVHEIAVVVTTGDRRNVVVILPAVALYVAVTALYLNGQRNSLRNIVHFKTARDALVHIVKEKNPEEKGTNAYIIII